MFKRFSLSKVAAVALASCALSQTAQADLPILTQDKWLGAFAGIEGRNANLKIDANGALLVEFIGENDEKIPHIGVTLRPFIVEPVDGKWNKVELIPRMLETSNEAQLDFTDLAFTATSDLGSKIKVTYNRKGDDLYFGADVLEKAETADYTSVTWEAWIPPHYNGEISNSSKTEKDIKALTKRDKLEFVSRDGKKVKAKLYEPYSEIEAELGPILKEKKLSEFSFETDAVNGTEFLVKLREAAGISMEFDPREEIPYMAAMGPLRMFKMDSGKGSGPWGFVRVK